MSMTRGKNSTWLHLPAGRVVQFAPARTRKGVRVPPRFLVLQPMASAARFRQTLCAGSIVGNAVEIDHGLAPEALRAAILERFNEWKALP
jgi:hypothetical protein